MKHPKQNITIQLENFTLKIPTLSFMKRVARKALTSYKKSTDITIRIVTPKTIKKLNKKFRHKDKVTNVLSFFYELENNQTLIGDIIICSKQVEEEAAEQNKPWQQHFAHMIVHGLLHLQGYTHKKLTEAKKMERREQRLLSTLGFKNTKKNRPKPRAKLC